MLVQLKGKGWLKLSRECVHAHTAELECMPSVCSLHLAETLGSGLFRQYTFCVALLTKQGIDHSKLLLSLRFTNSVRRVYWWVCDMMKCHGTWIPFVVSFRHDTPVYGICTDWGWVDAMWHVLSLLVSVWWIRDKTVGSFLVRFLWWTPYVPDDGWNPSWDTGLCV